MKISIIAGLALGAVLMAGFGFGLFTQADNLTPQTSSLTNQTSSLTNQTYAINDEQYLAVESASDASCIKYICAASRNDKKLIELARFARSSLDYMCDKNNIKKSECLPDAVVKKMTFLIARDRDSLPEF